MSAFRPILFSALRRGYTARTLLADLFAGVTVGLVALPLAMAFGIASIPEQVARELLAEAPWLTPPALGIYTAIVAGFLASLLGGSRFSISGPTGAFIVIIYGVAARHGYAGLAVATTMAGAMLVLLGLCRFGSIIKFIPYPVTTGFTAGIGTIIAASQLGDALGLTLRDEQGNAVGLPPEFLAKLEVIAQNLGSTTPAAAILAAGTFLAVFALRRYLPKLPGPILAIALATLAAWALQLPVATIGTRFGELPQTLPAPHLVTFDFALMRELLPEAGTIAMLCAIESLLCAVVADGMTSERHRSDTELIGQGVANVGAAMFFGIPATAAIARTVTNIKSGGRTPMAGILHAVCLVLFLLVLSPLLVEVPLAALAGLLLTVAWNMSEIDKVVHLLRGPRSDVLVLVATYGLTVFTDLTIAVGAGVVFASLLFMKRMADIADITSIRRELSDPDDAEPLSKVVDPADVPPGVELFQISGPFFFGVADKLVHVLRNVESPPKVFILRMRLVPAIDATGLNALEDFVHTCGRMGTTLLLSGVQPDVQRAMARLGLTTRIGPDNFLPGIDAALARARHLVTADGAPPVHRT